MVIRDLQAVTTPANCVLQSAPQQHAKRASLTRLETRLLTSVSEVEQYLKGGKDLGLELCWKG